MLLKLDVFIPLTRRGRSYRLCRGNGMNLRGLRIHPTDRNCIQQLCSMLLRYRSNDEHHYGRYKALSNNLEAFGPNGESLGIVFETATSFETRLRMHDLVLWTPSSISRQPVTSFADLRRHSLRPFLRFISSRMAKVGSLVSLRLCSWSKAGYAMCPSVRARVHLLWNCYSPEIQHSV